MNTQPYADKWLELVETYGALRVDRHSQTKFLMSADDYYKYRREHREAYPDDKPSIGHALKKWHDKQVKNAQKETPVFQIEYIKEVWEKINVDMPIEENEDNEDDPDEFFEREDADDVNDSSGENSSDEE